MSREVPTSQNRVFFKIPASRYRLQTTALFLIMIFAKVTFSTTCQNDGLSCTGTLRELSELTLVKSLTYVVKPDSGSCEHPVSSLDGETVEISMSLPNVTLTIKPYCRYSRQILVKRSFTERYYDETPCAVFNLPNGRVYIANFVVNNTMCALSLTRVTRVNRAALLVRSDRYVNDLNVSNISFVTTTLQSEPFDTFPAFIFISPTTKSTRIHLESCFFSFIDNATVKCDRCVGVLTVHNVSLVETSRIDGQLLLNGTNFKVLDIDVVIEKRSESTVTAMGFARYTVCVVIAILGISLLLEIFQKARFLRVN